MPGVETLNRDLINRMVDAKNWTEAIRIAPKIRIFDTESRVWGTYVRAMGIYNEKSKVTSIYHFVQFRANRGSKDSNMLGIPEHMFRHRFRFGGPIVL